VAGKQKKEETRTKEKKAINAANLHDGDTRGHGDFNQGREVRRSDEGRDSKTQKNNCHYIERETSQVHGVPPIGKLGKPFHEEHSVLSVQFVVHRVRHALMFSVHTLDLKAHPRVKRDGSGVHRGEAIQRTTVRPRRPTVSKKVE
jgi:hypothetical protein